METRRFQLRRFRSGAGGATLFFRALGGDRRHPAPFFRTEEVPPFDGDIAWFLAERAPRRGWRILRRIHPDGRTFGEATESPPRSGPAPDVADP
jgi:hypothetical protein